MSGVIARRFVVASLLLGPTTARPAFAQPIDPQPTPSEHPRPPPVAVVSALAAAAPDPCIDCDSLYVGECTGGLWRIDIADASAERLGELPPGTPDIGITSDRRLFSMQFSAALYGISACDASAVAVGFAVSANGLAGDPLSTDLLSQGPPLWRIATSGSFPVTNLGGQLGPDPPYWCGPSSGDLAFDPADGSLYATLGSACGCAGAGDMLVRLDPVTGGVLDEVGCVRRPDGSPVGSLWGLAFDRSGVLWAGSQFGEFFRIDPGTAEATPVPITGGPIVACGMASCPFLIPPPEDDCPPCDACAPRTQGFWKRQCAGPHPSGEHERLWQYVDGFNDAATFASVAEVAAMCERLHPDPPSDKCEQGEAQLAALLLNLVSGRVAGDCCTTAAEEGPGSALAVAAAADELLADVSRTFSDCVVAQSLSASLNEGRLLECGADAPDAESTPTDGKVAFLDGGAPGSPDASLAGSTTFGGSVSATDGHAPGDGGLATRLPGAALGCSCELEAESPPSTAAAWILLGLSAISGLRRARRRRA